MHLEVLVEDKSEKKVIEVILPQIIGDGDTFNINYYSGVGSIPKKNKKTRVTI